MTDFTSETTEAKREWKNMFKVPEEKKKACPPGVLYQRKISFRNEEDSRISGGSDTTVSRLKTTDVYPLKG